MTVDLYTKVVLTVIAIMLAVIVWDRDNPTVAHAQATSFSGVQAFSSDHETLSFFDPRTGEVWRYNDNSLGVGYGALLYKYQIRNLGQPLAQQK